jgi:SAM-dependent methyltransferase
LGALADRGFEVHGFEINEAAAAGADPRARICVGPNLAAVRYPDASFDQVIVWHVLEHLPDPRETLVEIRRILKPGGRIVVSVPNFNSLQARWAGPAWFHLDLPRHIYHFNARGLQSLLADCGFTCRRAHHFSIRQNPFGWLQSALNRLPGSRRNALYTLLKVGQKSASPDLCPATQTLLKLAYWLGMPIAGALSVAEAILRRGGSVCVTANATDDVRECH